MSRPASRRLELIVAKCKSASNRVPCSAPPHGLVHSRPLRTSTASLCSGFFPGPGICFQTAQHRGADHEPVAHRYVRTPLISPGPGSNRPGYAEGDQRSSQRQLRHQGKRKKKMENRKLIHYCWPSSSGIKLERIAQPRFFHGVAPTKHPNVQCSMHKTLPCKDDAECAKLT